MYFSQGGMDLLARLAADRPVPVSGQNTDYGTRCGEPTIFGQGLVPRFLTLSSEGCCTGFRVESTIELCSSSRSFLFSTEISAWFLNTGRHL